MRQRGKSPPTKNQSQNFIPEPLIRQFMPELDTLRGIAVLTVVFFHGFARQYETLPFQGAGPVVAVGDWAGMAWSKSFFRAVWILDYRHSPGVAAQTPILQPFLHSTCSANLTCLLLASYPSGCAARVLFRIPRPEFRLSFQPGRLVWHLDGIRATLVAVSRGALLHTLANRSAQSPHSIFGRNPGVDMHPCPNRASDIVS